MTLFRLVASGTTPGETFTHTLHADSALSPAGAALAWGDAIQAAMTAGWAAQMPGNVVYTLASAASIDTATDKQLQRSEVVLNIPGTSIAEILPFQCATAVSLRTAFATRSGRGRFYLPPLAANAIAGGRVAPASLTALKAGADALFDSLNTDAMTPVIRNRTLHISTGVTDGFVDDVIDTQRRRRNKLIPVRQAVVVP